MPAMASSLSTMARRPAAFIGTFIRDGQSWAHFDIAGVDYTKEPLPTIPQGYSGYGVRLLDQFIRNEREN